MRRKELTETEKKISYLKSYEIEKNRVRRIEAQIEELKLSKLSPSGMIGDGMPHSHNISDLSDYVAKVDELYNLLTATRYRRIKAYQDVQESIERMENEREKDLLTYHYLCGWKWERIAVELDYTYRHTTRMHGRALNNFKMS